MQITRWEDFPSRPWKNGGGRTRELLTWPPGSDLADFDCRVSVAEIDSAAEFSVFPGVRRHTVALAGAVRLVIDGQAHELDAAREPHAVLAYDGGRPARCLAPTGTPTRLLNVMTRPPGFECRLSWRTAPAAIAAGGPTPAARDLVVELCVAVWPEPRPAARTEPVIRIQLVDGRPR